MGVEFEEKRGPEFIYTKKDIEEIVARAVEEHVKEKEMIKANVNQNIVDKHRKSVLSSQEVLDKNGHVTPDEVVGVINNLRKEDVSVTDEDMKLYNQEISRGIVSSSENDGESESENIAMEVAHKKSA
ncbi:5382_t:CDS:2 [Rhizophagus irregularis]|nr:5382_t:CDS:2 [Rhizophagus irregularis]